MRGLSVGVVAVLLVSAGCVRRAVVAEAEALGEDVPPGMVDVNFASEDQRAWNVYAGDAQVCQTPCGQRIAATDSITLELGNGHGVFLHDVGPDAIAARRAVVVAQGPNRGEQVSGITFTTLGGMGMVVGTVLTAVGCSDTARRAGMCTAGLIVGGVSTALTAFAIWLIVDALPKAFVLPVEVKAR